MRPPARANNAAATIAPGAKSASSLQIAATTRVRGLEDCTESAGSLQRALLGKSVDRVGLA